MIDMTESKEILKEIKETSVKEPEKPKLFRDMTPLEVSEFNTKILSHPLVFSPVRQNLMIRPNYTPYCGNFKYCTLPRTFYDQGQFRCPRCGWVSNFPQDFMELYHSHWGNNV